MANEREELLIRDRVTQQPRPYYVHADNINLGDENNYQGLPAKLQQMTQAFTPDSAFDERSTRPIQNGVVKSAIDAINRAIDQLVGSDDVTTYIDSFNEVITFLAGVTNNETLTAKLYELQQAINSKQDTLTFDKAPTAGSDNPVESGGVYAALEEKANAASTLEALNNLRTALLNVFTKQEVINAISQMEATIEQQQLTVITGDKLSLWLDEDGESINIMAGEVPDIAATPTISHVINNDGTATVTIVNNEQGATIYYTIDGSTPTESSSVYNSPLTFNTAGTHTIKAIAVVQDKMKSSVATDTFSVVSCQTPVITVDNSARNQAVVTATAGNGESVSLSVGGQTATGTGSASVTINKTDSTQTLSASATATATGKLTATTTQNVTIDEKTAYVFGAHSLGGKAVAGTTQGDIKVSTTSSNQNMDVTLTEEDGVIWWEIDLQGKLLIGTNKVYLYNQTSQQATSGSIFPQGADKILTIEHIPEEVTSFNNRYVLDGCTNLTQFKVSHQSALTDDSGALKAKTSLVMAILPLSVNVLNGTFDGCTALETVYAPGAVRVLNGAFRNCTSLTGITIGTLTTVGANAFEGCTYDLDDIDFSHATSIGNQAFKSCTGLTSIDLSSATTIGSDAFRSSNLEQVTLSEQLTTIGGTSFLYCMMPSVDIPASVTSIGSMAFVSGNYMKEFHIKKVISSSSEAATVASNGLNNPANNPTIYVPVGTAEYYQAAWTAYASFIQEEPTNS